MSSVPAPSGEEPASRGFPALELTGWARRFGLVAGITTREDSFNLGLLTPDPAAVVIERWRRFVGAMQPGFPGCVCGLQVHGRELAVHRQARGWVVQDGVDGHATDRPGILLCVTVADCVPVFLAHPGSGTMVLLHAGWRGIAAGILAHGLAVLGRLSGAASRDLVMHCGVAICGSCYEVGPEVLEAVHGHPAPDRGPLDLRAVLAGQAHAAGVGEVTRSPWCTSHDGDRFFSHRRSAGVDGRMVAYLGKPVA